MNEMQTNARPLHRDHLPQLDGALFLSDGGMETSLIFHDGVDLSAFAAFPLLADEAGRDLLGRYLAPYVAAASELGTGFILETATWRANPDWAAQLGYDLNQLDALNRRSVAELEAVRDSGSLVGPVVISGAIGPRGDGYDPSVRMTTAEAEAYHSVQIGTFADTAADLVTAYTIGYIDEAIGLVRAAQRHAVPIVISFTVETDGHLPSGTPLRDAIEAVDAATDGGPAYYMVNCAHPTHFEHVLAEGAPWVQRIRGIRANASTRSHAELDEATELDAGDPDDLGQRYASLRQRFPHFNVLGGCCGTDHRHVEAIGKAVCGT